jgi:D-galactarolactone isomerase
VSISTALNKVTDAHMHVYESGYAIAAGAFHQSEPHSSVADYRHEMGRVGISRAVIVQPTAYGSDNSCTMAAVAALWPNARGIAIVDETVTVEELKRLTDHGIVGLRGFMMRGGRMTWDRIQKPAPRVRDFNWHLDIAFESVEFPERLELLRKLPTDVVIEHFGFGLESADGPEMEALLRFLDTEKAWVKLSSPFGVRANGERFYRDVDNIAKRLIAHAPERCVWGSNWPNAGFNHLVPKPDALVFLKKIGDWISDPIMHEKILVTNPEHLYGFER